MYFKEKVENIYKKISIGLVEKEEVMKLSLLAFLSSESIFLLGPPGVAKSLISRRIKLILENANSFEYLMNRFSTPDEIFGPISLTKLEEDKYERKIETYLPTSEIVFLDEIWKASSSIQNTLLTIINERIYKNGEKIISVPLKLLIAASNELPKKDEGLEALYDRFLFRVFVSNITNKYSFRRYIDSKIQVNNIDILKSEKFTLEEIKEIREKSLHVSIDEKVLIFIENFKDKLKDELEDNAPYISDRRWKKIVQTFKTSAFLANRKKVELCDVFLILDFVWENLEQKEGIKNVFIESFVNAVNFNGNNEIDLLEKIDNKIEEMDFSAKRTKKAYKKYFNEEYFEGEQCYSIYNSYKHINFLVPISVLKKEKKLEEFKKDNYLISSTSYDNYRNYGKMEIFNSSLEFEILNSGKKYDSYMEKIIDKTTANEWILQIEDHLLQFNEIKKKIQQKKEYIFNLKNFFVENIEILKENIIANIDGKLRSTRAKISGAKRKINNDLEKCEPVWLKLK